jgi:chromosomal replication initiator protein
VSLISSVGPYLNIFRGVFVVTQHHALDLWRVVLGELEKQVTRPVFETFLKGSQGTSIQDNVLNVQAPTAFAAEWLEKRAYRLIQSIGQRLNEELIDIRFHVVKSSNPSAIAVDIAEPNGNKGIIRSSWNLTQRFTFDSFVVGPSNQLAFSGSWAVAGMPGASYNPLFIYGGVGQGKTHLLHAIGHVAQAHGLKAVYVTTGQFTTQFIGAIQDRTTDDFRARYHGSDVLLIDDIQFIGGKEQTQEGFFHIFNELHNANKQIVLTSDRPPRSLSLLEDRLRSRFGWGLIVDIQPPDLETRIAILRAKARAVSVELEDKLLGFIARKVQRNVRELEGALNRLVAFCSFTGADMSVATAEHALADLFSSPGPVSADPEQVLGAVSRFLGVPRPALEGRRRDKKTATARQIAMYLLREELHLSYSDIGRLLGSRDHSTVTHAVNKIGGDINAIPGLRQAILDIKEELAKKPPH